MNLLQGIIRRLWPRKPEPAEECPPELYRNGNFYVTRIIGSPWWFVCEGSGVMTDEVVDRCAILRKAIRLADGCALQASRAGGH